MEKRTRAQTLGSRASRLAQAAQREPQALRGRSREWSKALLNGATAAGRSARKLPGRSCCVSTAAVPRQRPLGPAATHLQRPCLADGALQVSQASIGGGRAADLRSAMLAAVGRKRKQQLRFIRSASSKGSREQVGYTSDCDPCRLTKYAPTWQYEHTTGRSPSSLFASLGLFPRMDVIGRLVSCRPGWPLRSQGALRSRPTGGQQSGHPKWPG